MVRRSSGRRSPRLRSWRSIRTVGVELARYRTARRVSRAINIRPYRQFVIVFPLALEDAAVQGLQQFGERGEAEIPLIKSRVEPLDQRPDGGLARPRFTAARGQLAHGLGHQVGRVLQRCRFLGGGIQLYRGGGRGAGRRQITIEAELIAGELVAARGAARSDADVKAAVSTAPLRQRCVVAVGSDDDDVRKIRVPLQIIGHVQDQANIRAVLGAGQREELNEIHRVRLQFITVTTVILPVTVGAVHDDAPEGRRVFDDRINIDQWFLWPEPGGLVGTRTPEVVHQTGVDVLEVPVDGYRGIRIGHHDSPQGQDCRALGLSHRRMTVSAPR